MSNTNMHMYCQSSNQFARVITAYQAGIYRVHLEPNPFYMSLDPVYIVSHFPTGRLIQTLKTFQDAKYFADTMNTYLPELQESSTLGQSITVDNTKYIRHIVHKYIVAGLTHH